MIWMATMFQLRTLVLHNYCCCGKSCLSRLQKIVIERVLAIFASLMKFFQSLQVTRHPYSYCFREMILMNQKFEA